MATTPGPWKVCEHPSRISVSAEESGVVAYMSITQNSPYRARAFADAALIAAAPDMAAVLKEIKEDMDVGECEATILNRYHDALAAALSKAGF